MSNNKVRDFFRSLSNEIDSLVTKYGVIKIILVIGLLIFLKYIIGTYFHDYLFKLYALVLIVLAFFIISLEDDSKIKYLGVWIGSIAGMIFVITMFLMFVYGVGESVIETIYGWFS